MSKERIKRLLEKGFSIEDIKEIELEDFLIHINEIDEKITIINLFKIIKNLADKKYKKANWSEIRNDFREDKDLERRLNVINDIIDQKQISITHNSEIFEKLMEIDKQFDLMEYTNIEEAKKELGVKTPRFKRFRKDTYYPLLLDITNIFNEVYALHIEEVNKEKQKDKAHRRDLERMDKLAKYKIPTKLENFGESFSKNIQEDHEILTGEEKTFKERKLTKHKEEAKEKG
jgi:hypothetical protein